MGASFDMRIVSGKDINEITQKWNDMVQQDLYENGHSYSGSIGMLGTGFSFDGKQFETPSEAEDYICDVQEKWGGAIAVQIGKKKDGIITLAIGGWCSS